MIESWITGIGAVTPVGLSAPASAAAFRAAVARLTALRPEDYGPEGSIGTAVGGRVPLEWFDGGPRVQDWPGHERFEHPLPPPEHLLIEDQAERLVRLALPAAQECLRDRFGTGTIPEGWGLYLAIGEDEVPDTGQRVLAALREALPGFHPATAKVLPLGHAAGLAALELARTALKEGTVSGALVGAVDSLIRPSTLARLAGAGAVRGEANPQGVLPGEAAAFCILERQPRAGDRHCQLVAVATGDEPTAGTDEPNRAQGLTRALRVIRDAAKFNHMPLFISDMNGDRYRALEWGLVLVRVFGDVHDKPGVPESGETWHPADCIGDCGAASAIVNVVWAVEATVRNYAPDRQAVVWGASNRALRGAALIRKSD